MNTPHSHSRSFPAPKNAVLYIASLALLLATDARADDAGLFATTNQNPFIQIYSLPSPAEYAFPSRGDWTWRLAFEFANNSILEEHPAGEQVVLDGESYRTTLTLAYGLGPRLKLGIDIPLVAHSGGFLDGFIKDWHSLWGLSNERREPFENNALEFSYTRADGEHFALTERGRGIGDIRLSADWQARRAGPGERSLLIRTGIKWPTGSAENLRGSGSTDVSLQLLSTDPVTLSRWNMTLSWMLGGLWLGESDVLDDIRRDTVAVASVGIARPVWRRLSARLQLDGHSSFYDATLEPIGARSMQLTFGGSLTLRSGRLDVAVVETLFTDTVPDFGVHLAWRRGL
jgi:hypothetical protein